MKQGAMTGHLQENIIVMDCFYFEQYPTAIGAIDREKQIKKWRRSKKEWLINQLNPQWHFINDNYVEYESNKIP